MKKLMLIVAVLMALLMVVGAAGAQDVAPTAPDAEVVMNGWQVFIGVVGALLTGVGIGSVGALVVVRNFVTRLRNDAATTLAIEKLYQSIPNEAIRDVIREGILAGVEVLDYAEDVTDGELGAAAAGGRR